ncbi:collagen binding domain-containing protein [Lysinibacillus fusiformis]|uniref:collagen binding domain-containing protein n=1 Tax=Lysinibacillus fusiformis TaxID=28031 RepID=UPI0020BDFA6C|nr:collagen binding domain-containing protein [Lysinibacillus fusiformis]
MRKKLNIAMLTMLLVFQTLLSPLSVFASEDLSTPPVVNDNGSDDEMEKNPSTPVSNDTDLSEDNIGEEELSTTPQENENKEQDPEGQAPEEEKVEDEPAKTLPVDNSPLVPQEIPASLLSFVMKIGEKTVGAGEFGTELAPNTTANFTVKFSVPMQDSQAEAWGDGSWFEFQLPQSLIDFDGAFAGSKTVNGITYNYVTTDNKVRVELSGMEPGSGSSQPEELTVTFNSGFNNLSDDIEQDLEIPAATGGSEIIKVKFTFLPSTSNKKVSKEKLGTPTPAANGNHEMEWQVWVNEAGKLLSNPTLTDEPTSHEIMANSVNVYQYEVGLNGVRTSTENIVLTNGSWSDIQSTLTGKYAYKITYKTSVTLEADKRDGVVNFNNKVLFTNDGQIESSNTATHTITYGKALDKKLDKNTNYETKWHIDYNHNLLSIDQTDAYIIDTIKGPHEIDASSIKVYKMNDAAGNVATKVSEANRVTNGFTINPTTGNAKSFTLTFDNDISDAYTIVYDANYSKQDFYEHEAGQFNNSVTSGSGKEKNINYVLTENLLKKSYTVDFDKKVITWTINIVSDNPTKPINNLTLTDTFTAGAADGVHELIDNTVQLNDKAIPYTLIAGDKQKGFTISGINVPAGSTSTITYQTSFAIGDEGTVQKQGYGNTATTEWTSGGKLYEKSSSASYIPQSTTVNNGSKSGTFNYSTQQFTWDVKVNINKKDINGAILIDTVGEGHKYLPGTIEVLPLTNLGGSDTGGTIGTTPIDSNNYTISAETDKGFTLTFRDSLSGDINYQAYVVRYNTMDDDHILGIGSDTSTDRGNVYTNDATFKTKGTQEFTLESTPVKIDENVANNLVTKNKPQQNASKETITWTLDVNKSHSDLGQNVILTDLPGNNLMLLESSILLAPYTVSKTGIQNGSNWQTPLQLGVTVKFDTQGGFSLEFPDLNRKGYQVQYKTIGFGQIGDALENTATLHYTGQTKANQKTESDYKGKFNFSSSESDFSSTRGSAKFKKIGIDSATGQFKENLAGVEFQLIKKTAKPNEYIIQTATTDANGEFTFENVPYNDYLIREVAAPTGYTKMSDFKFKLDENTTLNKQLDLLTQLVNTTPIVGGSCTQFEIEIKDIDGHSITIGTVTLKDTNGTETAPYKVTNGKVTLPNHFTAGEYTVTHSVEGELGKVIVKYDGGCKAVVQPVPKCENYTIVVKDGQGNIRTNILELTLKQGTTVVTKVSPDAVGKFTVHSNDPTTGVKPGEYTIYEGNQFLGTVTLTYKKSCGYEFTIIQAPKCEAFELTVKDVDGELIADKTKVTIKDLDGKTVATEETKDGKVELKDLEPGVYRVFDKDGNKIGEFSSNINCQAEVQQTPACERFTVELKDANNVLIKAGKDVVIKDKQGNVISTGIEVDGSMTFVSKDVPAGKYDVYDNKVYLGEIVVSYKQICKVDLSVAPACPNFTLTINNMYGQPREGVKVTFTDEAGVVIEENGSTEFTTNNIGQITISNSLIRPGKYMVKENGITILGTVTVGNTCEANIQPTPPVTNPTDPDNPTSEPGQPVDPTKPNPDPEKPVDPNKPKPDPEKPVDPNKPNPDPEKPVDPNKPKPDPEKPVDPNNPKPDTNKPTTPGNGGTSAQNVIDQGKQLPPYNPSNVTKDTLDAYKDFLKKYSKLSKDEQTEVAQAIDINKIKADAERLEAQLRAHGKLPQTDGANQTALVFVGLLLVAGSIWFMRRRTTEI